MAETHTNLRDNSVRLKRNVSKIAFRTTEKVMRTFGRSEETKDEILDHYVMLINKQQLKMQKLQRDMQCYVAALKAFSVSQKAFFNTLYEVYDNDWAGKDVIASCSQRNQLLHDDVFARIQSEVTEALQEHLQEYHTCKFKVEKRGRKLVDYDAARRSLQSLQAAKKPDDTKIDRAKDHVQQAQETYEELNNQLHEQLPSLYDSRLPFCVDAFSSVCNTERQFLNEAAELRSRMNNVLLNLKSAYDCGEYHIQRMHPPLDNGRVLPSSASGHSRDAPSKVRSSSTCSSSSQTKTNGESSLPPRSPTEGSHGSPGSNPSTHEYVNLQVGMPDVVKPVSESEEETGDGGSRKKADEEMYLSPNVNREELGYIMASDPVLPRNKSKIILVQPKPSPRSKVFRNVSNAEDMRAPAPKPLPRTLSAPLGERPQHLRQNKSPSLAGKWRVAKNQYTDVMLRRPNHNKPPRQTASLQHFRELQSESSARPMSMLVVSTAATSHEGAGERRSMDDGSGHPDPKRDPPDKTKAATMAAQPKSGKANGQQGGKKGFLGFMGFKRHGKDKAPPPPPTSKAPPPPPESKAPPPVPSRVVVTAASVAEESAGELQPKEESEATPPEEDQPISKIAVADDKVVKTTALSKKEESDSETEDMDAAFKRYADGGDEADSPANKGDEIATCVEENCDDKRVDLEQAAELASSQGVEIDAKLEKLHVENEPVFSRPVMAVEGGGEYNNRAEVGASQNEHFQAFPEPPSASQLAFPDDVDTTVQTSIDDAFSPQGQPQAGRSDSGSTGSSVKDMFGLKPFGSEQDGPEKWQTDAGKPDECVVVSNDEAEHDGIRTPPPSPSLDPAASHDLESSSDPDEDNDDGENTDVAEPTSELKDQPPTPMQQPDGYVSSASEATSSTLEPEDENETSLVSAASIDSSSANSASEKMFIEPQPGQPVTSQSLESDEMLQSEIKPLEVDLSDSEDNEIVVPRSTQDSLMSFELEMAKKLQRAKQESEVEELIGKIDEKLASPPTSSEGHGKVSNNEFGKPEPQSPPSQHKPNGAKAKIQPIYEEPPREEDLPSYNKPVEKPEPPPPRSPTKSDDSHKYLDLPPNYLYSVQALYVYRSTDDDELSFEKGEIIHIVEHPDPEEQDEGWQMGVRQKDWEEKSDLESGMGVFPENFTKRIQL